LHMCMYVKVKSCQAWHVGPCFRSIEIPANIFSKILHDVCVSSTDRRFSGLVCHPHDAFAQTSTIPHTSRIPTLESSWESPQKTGP
jgi:hypothetical protein